MNGRYAASPGSCKTCVDLERRVAAVEQQLEQAKYSDFKAYNENMSASQVVLCWVAKYGHTSIESMSKVVGHVFTYAALKGAMYNLNRVKVLRRVGQGEYVLNYWAGE